MSGSTPDFPVSPSSRADRGSHAHARDREEWAFSDDGEEDDLDGDERESLIELRQLSAAGRKDSDHGGDDSSDFVSAPAGRTNTLFPAYSRNASGTTKW